MEHGYVQTALDRAVLTASLGYYNSYNYELSAITINLEKAPTA